MIFALTVGYIASAGVNCIIFDFSKVIGTAIRSCFSNRALRAFTALLFQYSFSAEHLATALAFFIFIFFPFCM